MTNNELIGYWAFASETEFNSQIYILLLKMVYCKGAMKING